MKKKILIGDDACLGIQLWEIQHGEREKLSLTEIEVDIPNNLCNEYNTNTSAEHPKNIG